MNKPAVSVIIPAYNGADHLAEAIQSVLDQNYPYFELIVVNDASPDHTDEVVKQVNDSRLKYIVHSENQGAVAARETALHASSGEFIAFLDQDDLFHPDKLQTHVAFLEKHPEVGVTYNGHFHLLDSSKRIRRLWQTPPTVTLSDLLLGFPFGPSDTVFRRKWAIKKEIWDSSFVTNDGEPIFNGAEYVYLGRLFMAGCKFANVGRVLNYRRYHSERILSNLARRCRSEYICQDLVFSDPRCPSEVFSLRNVAFANTYVDWAYYAYVQNEIALGQQLLQEAIRLDPAILDGKPCKLVNSMVYKVSSIGLGRDHETIFSSFFDHLPVEIAWLSGQRDWALAQANLLKGVMAIIWEWPEDEKQYFSRASDLGVEIDELFLRQLTDRLLKFEVEFGEVETQNRLQTMLPYLEKLDNHSSRWLKGHYSINRAFQNYQSGVYKKVPTEIFHAVIHNPKYLLNRGVLSILARSMIRDAAH